MEATAHPPPPSRYYGSLAEEGGAANDIASTPASFHPHQASLYQSDDVAPGRPLSAPSRSRLRTAALAVGGVAAFALAFSWADSHYRAGTGTTGLLSVPAVARTDQAASAVSPSAATVDDWEAGGEEEEEEEAKAWVPGVDLAERHNWPQTFDGHAIDPDHVYDNEAYGDYYVFFTAARYTDSPLHGGTYLYGAENGRMDLYSNLTRDAYAIKMDPLNATIVWTTVSFYI